jgi:molybdopterin synthase catalytic subunit
MSVSIQAADFDAGRELANLAGANRGIGAVASFVGYVRADHGDNASDNDNESSKVTSMTLEHYPGMTERALQEIVDQARLRWTLDGVRVIHRVGCLLPGEQIVLVAVAARHRGDAFAACEFIMDFLKTRAPFWKKEATPQGANWVDARDSDDAAAARWGEASAPAQRQY